MRGLRISFRMLLVPLLVVVLVAAWAAWWWLSGTLFRQFLDSFVAAERARGTEIHFTGPRLGGFPLGVHATFTDVAFSRPDGLSWQAPEVDVGVPLWQPGALHLRVVGHQELRLPAGQQPAAVTADGAEGRLILGGAQGFTEARLVLSGLGLPQATAVRVKLGFDAPAAAVTAHTDAGLVVTVTAEGIQAPAAGSLSLGPAIESLAVTARVMGAPPRLDPDSLSAWSRNGGTLELDTASLHWGPLALGAEGSLSLDQELQPVGSITAEVAGFKPAIEALVAAGWIKAKAGQTVSAVLTGLVERPEGAPPPPNPTARIPISLHDRFVHIGPFRLAPLPPVVWQRPAAG